MSTIVRDLARSRVLIPAYEAPELVDAQCAQCESPIRVLAEHVENIPNGVDVHAVCVECIPDYLKG